MEINDNLLEEIENMIPDDEKLNFVKIVNKLGLHKNDETLALLYVHVYLRILYEDLPKSITNFETSINRLNDEVMKSLGQNADGFAKSMNKFIQDEFKLLDKKRDEFSIKIEAYLEGLKDEIKNEKDSAMSQFTKMAIEHENLLKQKAVDYENNVKLMRQNTIESVIKLLEKKEKVKYLNTTSFIFHSAAVLFGVALFNILSRFF